MSRTLDQHHALISSVGLSEAVPEKVRQLFENARNAWLYSFYAYHLLSIAALAVHVACEGAVKERAARDGLPSGKTRNLQSLLNEALSREWVTDAGFSASASREARWNEQREVLQAIGCDDIGPWQDPEDLNRIPAKSSMPSGRFATAWRMAKHFWFQTWLPCSRRQLTSSINCLPLHPNERHA